jgi:hypothetical protein
MEGRNAPRRTAIRPPSKRGRPARRSVMGNFLINTPSHKRWWLPDRRHQYNSVLYGDRFYCSIIDSHTGMSKDHHQILIKDGWEDLAQTAQELAAKRYRSRRIRDDIPSVLKGRR